MSKNKNLLAKGCGITAAVTLGIPLLIASIVGVQTCVPLQKANKSLAQLEQSLGSEADYVPSPSGAISASRLNVFMTVRKELVSTCGDYSSVQEGFESVENLDENEPGNLGDVGHVAGDLGGAALAITPFLANFFAARNNALLASSMGLQEYAYIYAVAYHQQLLSPETRQQIFSDDVPLSPEASLMLQECLEKQSQGLGKSGTGPPAQTALADEIQLMSQDPSRLLWQDGLPEAITASLAPYRERLDSLFFSPTAGLEMEQTSGRAIRIALY